MKLNLSNRMMIFVLMLLSQVACTSGPSVYETEWQEKRAQYESQMVKIKCKTDKFEITTLGNCDTESEKFYSNFAPIKAVVCNKKMSMKECSLALYETLVANYEIRYPHADWYASGVWCRANPQICSVDRWKGALQLEIELMRTHNKYLHDRAMAEKAEIQERSDRDVSQTPSMGPLQFLGGVLQGAGQGLMHAHDNTVTCTNFGNGTYSCSNQGRTYQCNTFGNMVQCQ